MTTELNQLRSLLKLEEEQEVHLKLLLNNSEKRITTLKAMVEAIEGPKPPKKPRRYHGMESKEAFDVMMDDYWVKLSAQWMKRKQKKQQGD